MVAGRRGRMGSGRCRRPHRVAGRRRWFPRAARPCQEFPMPPPSKRAGSRPTASPPRPAPRSSPGRPRHSPMAARSPGPTSGTSSDFAGPRGLYKYFYYNYEAALLAAGLKRDEVFPYTTEKADMALGKIKELKPNVTRLVGRRRATAATAFDRRTGAFIRLERPHAGGRGRGRPGRPHLQGRRRLGQLVGDPEGIAECGPCT